MLTGNELKDYIYVCIISADNDEFNLTEDDKQEIMRRRELSDDWGFILEPIQDEKQRDLLVSFFDRSD